jgi:hypothetical protein
MPADRDRSVVFTMAALVALRAALIGGISLMFLYLAGAVSAKVLALAIVPLFVIALLLLLAHVRLARKAGR